MPMYVYAIRCRTYLGDFYKIGKASDVNRRLKQLQTGCPFKLEVLAFKAYPNAFYVETKLHYIFSKRCIRGEWFELSPSQIRWLLNRLGTKKTLPFNMLLDRYLTVW